MRFRKQNPSFGDLEGDVRRVKNKFLEKIDQIVDWKPIEVVLKRNYKQIKNATGNLAYPPLAMFKVLLLQRFYNLSDPAMEENLNDRISFLKFTGFSMSSELPDHSTISRFRNRLLKSNTYEKLFYEFQKQLKKQGLIVNTGAIVDASIIQSSRRPRKKEEDVVVDRDESEHEGTSEKQTFYSEDREARFVRKGERVYYGYKSHAGVDVQHGFVRGGHMTSANKSDMNELEEVILESGVSEGERIYGDKGYDSEENRKMLKEKNMKDGIMRRKKRGRPESSWNTIRNKRISRYRYIIERTFGTFKRQYGLDRLRYIGIEKAQMEFWLVSMCFNLKKASRLMSA